MQLLEEEPAYQKHRKHITCLHCGTQMRKLHLVQTLYEYGNGNARRYQYYECIRCGLLLPYRFWGIEVNGTFQEPEA